MTSVSQRDGQWTPDPFYNKIFGLFGPFDLDVCASPLNTKCERFFIESDDALTHDWCGSVWCNPPYKNLIAWVEKAHREVSDGRANRVVMLLPGHVGAKWYHFSLEYGSVIPVNGKLKFGGAIGVPFFGSVVCIFPPIPNPPRSLSRS